MKTFLVAALLAIGVKADLEFFFLDQNLPIGGRITDPLSGSVGLTAADQICMKAAGKRFVAAMSDPHTDMKYRFDKDETFVRRSDHVSFGTDREAMFAAGGIANTVLSYSGAAPVSEFKVYTGAAENGVGSADTCNGWQVNTSGKRGELGIPSSKTQWYRSAAEDCNLPQVNDVLHSLYCVEQAKVACIFATDAPVDLTVHKGRAGLDQYCQDTFSNGKPITATFAALVSDADTDAIDIFPEDEGSYLLINTEGNVVQSLQYELFKSGTLFDNKILTLARTTPAEPRVWVGSKTTIAADELNSDYGVADGSNTCFNWNSFGFDSTTLAAASGSIGDVSLTDQGVTITGTTSACNELRNLICVQTSTVTTSTVHGDPHFAGFDGSRYNFDGVNGEIFNIITDSNFLFNAEFTEMEIYETTGTWMTKLGFRAGKETIVFDPAFGLLINNEELVKSGEHFTTEEFEIDIQWKNQRPANIVVRAAGYEVVIKPVQIEPSKTFLDVQVALFVNPVKPHGVLGQTARFIVDGSKPNPVNSKAKNAQDLLEGTYTDYMVKDGILGTDFTYSTFDGLVSGRGHLQTRNFSVARSSFVPLSWKESF